MEQNQNFDKMKRRNLWVIFFINLFHGLGAGMFNVVYQPYIYDLTSSILITGILITIGGIVQFLPMPFVGKLSDRYGRKKLMLTSIPFYVIGLISLIYSNPNALILLVIGIIFYFLGAVMNNINILIFASENTETSKGLMYGLIMFSFFAGTIGGSTFVLFGTAFDTRFFFILFIIILIVEWVINLVFISEKFRSIKNPKTVSLETIDPYESIWKKIFKTPKSKSVLIFFTLDLFIYSIGLSIYRGGLRGFYNISREEIALITLVFNISNMVFQIPFGHIADKIGKKKSLILSQFFGLSFFFINILAFFVWWGGFTAFLLPALVISHIPFAMSVCTFIPSEQIALTDLDETNKAQSYGIVGFIRGIGFIPTGYIGGFLVDNVHYIAPLIISFVGIFFETWYLYKYFHD
ncbi:MAG: MFS transporter [Promethearchaeota archaeon]|nr:MAG: MFS transporter [Candidatus Lokiarchaeota archaeon]